MGLLKYAWPFHQVHTDFHSSSYLVPLSVPRQQGKEEKSPELALAGGCCCCRRCWEPSCLRGTAPSAQALQPLDLFPYTNFGDASCKQRGSFPTPAEGMWGYMAGDQSNSSACPETDQPTCSSLLSNKVLAIRTDDCIPSNPGKSTRARSSLLCRAWPYGWRISHEGIEVFELKSRTHRSSDLEAAC